ncbi:TPA_asm: fusion protein [Papaver pavoninum amalgavirus 1]|nr:TPA_asm: fusion protein [Papaver pavoninum amalgavirus 1]
MGENRAALETLFDPAKEAKDLDEGLATLWAAGCDKARFTRLMIHAAGRTVPAFLKEIKGLLAITDQALLARIWGEAITANLCSTPILADVLGICKFAKWLKGKDGVAVVNNLQLERKIEKKKPATASVADSSLASLLDIQVQDYAQKRRAAQSEGDREIDRIKKKLEIAKKNLRVRLSEIDDRFSPASIYEAPTATELGSKCWNRYIDDCAKEGKDHVEFSVISQKEITDRYSTIITAEHKLQFCSERANKEAILEYTKKRILELDAGEGVGKPIKQDSSWHSQVEERLGSIPVSRRLQIMSLIPVGVPQLGPLPGKNLLLSQVLTSPSLQQKGVRGYKAKGPLPPEQKITVNPIPRLETNIRVNLIRPLKGLSRNSIPTARSKFEAATRRVIGGGEMNNWREVSNMCRGGGSFADALVLLGDADESLPGKVLRDYFTVQRARSLLSLPSDLEVLDSRQAVTVRHFNEDATAGPFLRALNVPKKFGLKRLLEEFAWSCYDMYASGCDAEDCLPWIAARVGYRTKLMSNADAVKKRKAGKPLGRCVMMLDAIEQPFSSPLYNVLSDHTARLRRHPDCGFRNAVVRASSDWLHFWSEVKEAAVIVELDWKKFDRERPVEDIAFMIDVIISCFKPANERQCRLLEAYRVMLNRALIDRLFVTDDGGVFGIDGMVPSGSLWTGWLDTALNILYLRAAMISLGIGVSLSSPKCAGDDNLTLFKTDFGNDRLLQIKVRLNQWFRAGIEDDEFLIHRPPYFVHKEQARFPPGTDLSKGTSKIVHMAKWVKFEGEPPIKESKGWSHRWKYVFEGRPKFLSCYWLEDGLPIRPTYINAEKLLFPEGIHKDIHQYMAAVVSMIVDNPFNHHNVNHMMHRFMICQQAFRQSATGIAPEEILFYSQFRSKQGSIVPYPMVGSWRRVERYVDMLTLPFLKEWTDDLQNFIAGISSLYGRDAQGGVDAWKFVDFIRGESELGCGQFGNDVDVWVRWLNSHPLTKYLRPTRKFRAQKEGEELEGEELEGVIKALEIYKDIRGTEDNRSVESFCNFISTLLDIKGDLRALG